MSETKQGSRRQERGAALITALLISFLLLAAGGALMVTVGFSVGNTAEPMSEMQAYYAAESGMQQVLNALRGHVAPDISYRKAITPSLSNNVGDTSTSARLSRWLPYDAAYPDRVLLSPAGTYAPLTGTAFNAVLRDPDNSHLISFTTSGAFSSSASGISSSNTINTATLAFGNSIDNNVGSIVFTNQDVSAINAYPTVASMLGSFTVNGSPVAAVIPVGTTTFDLTITQTLPWPATVLLRFAVQGRVSNLAAIVSDPLRLTLNSQKYLAEGVEYDMATLSFPLLSSASGFINNLPVTIVAPQPRRILIDVTGFGPRASIKRMQMMVGRLLLDYSPQGTIAIRGADTIDSTTGQQTLMTFSDGNSNPHTYSGNPPSGGTAISAFAVTNTPDYNMIQSIGNVSGNPAVQQVPLSRLPPWLQNADSARALLNSLESVARSQGRLFSTDYPPPDIGTLAIPKFTFVNGDADLGSSGGAGLMVVTGTLTTRGAANFDGLILILGGGRLTRDGGGNGDTLGAVAIARFDRNLTGGPYLAPTFDTNGGGNSNVQFDPNKVNEALGLAGRQIIAMREY